MDNEAPLSSDKNELPRARRVATAPRRGRTTQRGGISKGNQTRLNIPIIPDEANNFATQNYPIPTEDIVSESDRPDAPEDDTNIIIDGEPIAREDIEDMPLTEEDASDAVDGVYGADVAAEEEDEIILPAPAMSHVDSPMRRHNLETRLEERESVGIQAPDNVIAPPPQEIIPKIQTRPIPSYDHIPRYSEMPPEEQAHHRATFRTKFGILRNAWPSYNIPNVSDTMPLEEVHIEYDVYIRHIHITKEVDQYKIYLVGACLIVEGLCAKMHIDASGYTVSQSQSMSKYDSLLMELGETNYINSYETAAKRNWSVEMRIIFMCLANAVTFIVIKLLAGYLGEGTATQVVEYVSSYLRGGTPAGAEPSVEGPRVSENASPFGSPGSGLDVPSLLANLGSMFINKPQTPAAPTQGRPPVNEPQKEGRNYKPAYDE